MQQRRRIHEDSCSPCKPKQRPHFFKVIVKTSLEKAELMIPTEFTRQYAKEVAEVAVIKVPSGRKWQIEVKKVDGTVWFRNGFRGFLKYYSISIGHFLVFRYDGNSTFSVFIFNQSACEMNYPSDSDQDIEEFNLPTLIPSKKEPEEEDSAEPLDVCVPSQLLVSSRKEALDKTQELRSSKRRRPGRSSFVRKQRRRRNTNCQELKELGVENEIEVIEVPSDNPNDETSMSTSSHPNPDADNALALIPRPSAGTATHKTKKGLDPSLMKIDVFSPPSERYDNKVKRYNKVLAARKKLVTKKQREKTICAAQMFKTKNPSFMVIMRPTYVYRGMALNLPKSFAKNYLKLEKGTQEVKLSISDGRKWMVRCILSQWKAFMSRGWPKFVQDNQLEEGDCCVFELSKAKGLELKISIFRVVEDAEPMLKYYN
ncbi:hypothetical protein NE237_023092 [Protea cynaroides]|uniref:TF-B3 domain-containing protein n=1 Tax=Protea cynaroides TaxID=273540 RepID=A0A9Q0K6C6_9MAGN|nr:hypothetical protein NE237_023092 [Protea cynaroides]